MTHFKFTPKTKHRWSMVAAGQLLLIAACGSENQSEYGQTIDSDEQRILQKRELAEPETPLTNTLRSAIIVAPGTDNAVPIQTWDFADETWQGWALDVASVMGMVQWNLDSVRPNGTGHSLYFGNPDPNPLNRNYDSGQRVAATIETEAMVDLPNQKPLYFDLHASIDVEHYSSTHWDQLNLFVETSNGSTQVWRQRADEHDPNQPDRRGNTCNSKPDSHEGSKCGKFEHFRVDISEFAGQPVRFRVSFDSQDGAFNKGEGIYISEMSVSRTFKKPDFDHLDAVNFITRINPLINDLSWNILTHDNDALLLTHIRFLLELQNIGLPNALGGTKSVALPLLSVLGERPDLNTLGPDSFDCDSPWDEWRTDVIVSAELMRTALIAAVAETHGGFPFPISHISKLDLACKFSRPDYGGPY